jgi:hypothetical protein
MGEVRASGARTIQRARGETLQEGIPLAEVLWALALTKGCLLEYLGAYGLADSAMELYQQQELDGLTGHFLIELFAIRPLVTSARF